MSRGCPVLGVVKALVGPRLERGETRRCSLEEAAKREPRLWQASTRWPGLLRVLVRLRRCTGAIRLGRLLRGSHACAAAPGPK